MIGKHKAVVRNLERDWQVLTSRSFSARLFVGKFSLVTLTYHFETLGLFWDGFVILNHGQIMRTTPELAPPLQTSAPYQRDSLTRMAAMKHQQTVLHMYGKNLSSISRSR
ncbi:hypothetical protein AVEN_4173-1 [Araneus ventricosus]|uniref:Uncharacterized protein n=1 Tax=Araneus ventricosus TaxID=182803 RepID=A0A4Y2FHV0_ARAVE|nr:hypothetical protein AVEN_4173-1 [Araneus ventricosus]